MELEPVNRLVHRGRGGRGAAPDVGGRVETPSSVARTRAESFVSVLISSPHDEHQHHHGHGHDSGDGLEWEDLMPEINARTDAANMFWRLVDDATGAENTAIDWRFTVGDRVKLRLVNTMDSDHPMHHPFHIHGAGRFLVIDRDGQPSANLVWKDSVLVRAGETVDLLLEITEPGMWMAHCHIAEHNQDGMMFSFRVDPA